MRISSRKIESRRFKVTFNPTALQYAAGGKEITCASISFHRLISAKKAAVTTVMTAMKEECLSKIPESCPTATHAAALPALPLALEQKLHTPFSCCSSDARPGRLSAASLKPLEDLLARHLRSGGQRIRARLAWRAAHSLSLDPQTGMALACCCEWLHNASLIHDDIQDGDTLRRGAPALWAVVGIGPAICAGDALISAAYGVLREVQVAPARQAALLESVQAAVSQTIVGQLDDWAARQSATTRFADYEAIAARKSGPLLGLPLALALIASGSSPDSRALANRASAVMTSLGIAYQLLDDLEDWPLDQRNDHRPLMNAVLLEMQQRPPHEAKAWVEQRAREWLQEAEQQAAALPSDIQSLVFWLAGRIGRALDAG